MPGTLLTNVFGVGGVAGGVGVGAGAGIGAAAPMTICCVASECVQISMSVNTSCSRVLTRSSTKVVSHRECDLVSTSSSIGVRGDDDIIVIGT